MRKKALFAFNELGREMPPIYVKLQNGSVMQVQARSQINSTCMSHPLAQTVQLDRTRQEWAAVYLQ